MPKPHFLQHIIVPVHVCPLGCEDRCLEKLLLGVLLEDILAIEMFLRQLVNEQLVTGYQLLFGVARIENESLVLRDKEGRS